MSNTRRTGTAPEADEVRTETTLPVVSSGGGDAPAAVAAPVADPTARREYDVTALAGPRVAGRLVDPESRTVFLTEHEALDELLSGTIKPKGDELHAMFTRTEPPAAPEAAS
ncbi:hypothetical protein [Aureimonas sp. SK2]|uniref:hypothetical protein n=1 Tax=Aureimonas sp. SK2 TaxID=3015992 RepID=UPI0024440F5E|nr:hypothetical protein [Aureimonas sp. SK2]